MKYNLWSNISAFLEFSFLVLCLMNSGWSARLRSHSRNTWTCAWGWWLTCGFWGIKLTDYIRYTVMFLISTQPTDTFTRLQIRFATLIFHSQKPVSIIQHFTIGYSEACETFRWVRPMLRSDTLKIKAIDLCSGRDSLPAWHAVLAALWLVCQWGSVCVCASMHGRVYIR